MEPTTQEWSHAQWVLSELNQQRGLGKFCNVTLTTHDGQVFMAHRNVLACFSKFIQDTTTVSTDELLLDLPPECTADGIKLLLHFVYTGEIQLNSENKTKLRHAASGLHIPDSLLRCHDLNSQKATQSTEAFKMTEHNPDLVSARQANSQPALENKTEDSETSISATEEFLATSSAKTTRSGRRVRGPSRLVWESIKPVVPKQISRTKRGLENNGDGDIPAEAEHSIQVLVMDKDGPEVGQLNNAEEEDDDGSMSIDILTEETDEEYMPQDLTTTSSKSAKRKHNTPDKENGQNEPQEKKDSVQCPTCQKTFQSKYYLKVHNRRHTGEKPFKCSKCGKCYYRKDNLIEHEARNCLRNTNIFSCSSCPLTFKRKDKLHLHTAVSHTGEMPNKCTACSEQFMYKRDLDIHMIKVHGAPKPHACSLCPKRFRFRTELNLHIAARHRGEKLFVCEECGHRSSSRNGLNMHIKAVHRNERPFVCQFCSHAFTQKANLNMHLRTHTGERPFQCHLCGKTFRTQASLDKHNRTHTGERPYSCEFCEQRFTEKGPLVRHIASKHQEGQPHICSICNKSFKAIDQLRVHVRRHKGMRNFECTECGYKFTRQAHLRRHMQIHNRVENYNPRQRKLRNLVVKDEKADATTAPLLEQHEETGIEPAAHLQSEEVPLMEDVLPVVADVQSEEVPPVADILPVVAEVQSEEVPPVEDVQPVVAEVQSEEVPLVEDVQPVAAEVQSEEVPLVEDIQPVAAEIQSEEVSSVVDIQPVPAEVQPVEVHPVTNIQPATDEHSVEA